MHNRDLNALQFQTITVRHHEHATPFYTVKYGPILGSATITNSAWSTNNSDLSITGKTATTTTTSAKFTASHPGTYTAVNTVTDSDGEIIQRKIILVYDTATYEPQYVYSGTPSTPTNLDLPWISIEEFGAIEGVGNSAVNDVAYADAAAWLALQTEAKAIVWPAGIWEISVCPNFAVAHHAQLLGFGVVRWRYTGTGDCFILDGGTSVFNMRVGPFLIEGHDGSGDGVYIQGVHHSYLDFNVRGCGTTQAGLRTEWCVVNKYHYICSGNEGGGFYNDGTGVAKPKYGVYLDDNASGQFSTYGLFIDPIIEGCEIGVYIPKGAGNQFNGGTIEGNTDWGVKIDSGSFSNKFIGGDFEANTNGDILVSGAETDIIGSDSDSLIQFSTGGRDSKIIGGACDSITVDSGLTGVKLQSTSYNRTGSGVYTNSGTGTEVNGLTNIGTAQIHGSGGAVTTTRLNDVTDVVNTVKQDGWVKWNTTSNRPVWANGSAAGSVWVYADGTTAHTPV